MNQERKEQHEHEAEVERRRRDEEAGWKGGAAAMVAGTSYAAAEEGIAVFGRDLVRWGPIWAGLLLALGIQFVLGAIGLAIALSAYNPTAANYGARVGSTLGIWTAISALIALFVGGYAAGRMAAVLGLRNGLTQGSIVWALALVLGTILSALGAVGLLGATANIGPLLTGQMAVTGAQAQSIASTTASGAWWFVIGTILAWAAAAGGGMLGTAAHRGVIEEPRR
jgi:hypothetical protein